MMTAREAKIKFHAKALTGVFLAIEDAINKRQTDCVVRVDTVDVDYLKETLTSDEYRYNVVVNPYADSAALIISGWIKNSRK